MSSSRRSDLSRIPTVSLPSWEPPPAARQGGAGDTINDINMEEELVVPTLGLGINTYGDDVDVDMINVSEEQILDFNDTTQVAHSRVQCSSPITGSKPVPTATIDEEVIVQEPIQAQPVKENKGAFVSSKTTVASLLFENKSYWLFCSPTDMSDCLALCRKYIGQGSTLCVAKNCSINHRKSEQISSVSWQLFVLKTKDVVFAKPTSDLSMDDVLLTKWSFETLPLHTWREKFQHVCLAAEAGVGLDEKEIKVEEDRATFALEFKTPSKRRVRESLEDKDQDICTCLQISNIITPGALKRHLEKIDGDLLRNQLEHDNFRDYHIKLEDNIREAAVSEAN